MEDLKKGQPNRLKRRIGETRGGVELVVDVDKISEKETDAIEFVMREERRPFWSSEDTIREER